MQQLHTQQKQGRIHNTIHAKKEKHTLHSIKEKLTKNNAVITKADKGRSVVITYAHDYHKKIMQFICSSNFDTVPHDPINRFKKVLPFNITNCPLLIPQDQKWRYVNLNPTPPTIRGLIKLHKQGHPIRPIVNWTNAPAYKTAKLLTQKLATYSPSVHFQYKNPLTFNCRSQRHSRWLRSQIFFLRHNKYQSISIY
jgi:hypothetical protein